MAALSPERDLSGKKAGNFAAFFLKSSLAETPPAKARDLVLG